MEQYIVEFLSMAVAVLLSLLFEFFPGVSTWFEAKSATFKKNFIGVVMFFVGAAVVGLSCAGIIAQVFPDLFVTCDVPGAMIVFRAWIAAWGAAQGFHVIFNRGIHAVATALRGK